MQFAAIIAGLIIFAAALALAVPSRWSWPPLALAVALPLVVALAGQSTQDDSPQSLAIAYAVVVSAPIICGTAVGSGAKRALRARRQQAARATHDGRTLAPPQSAAD
jgi:1,4-dihydroxy-2-naphthoate octaprenyltransferase